jgi:hypothetical protein
MTLLAGYQRHDPDDAVRREIWEAERKINEIEHSSVESRVIM